MLFLCMGISLTISAFWALKLLQLLLLQSFDQNYQDKKRKENQISASDFINEAVLDQLLPIKSTKWGLVKCEQGVRIWNTINTAGQNLQAVVIRIKASALNLPRFLMQTGSFYEWRPGVSVHATQLNHGSQFVRWKQKKSNNPIIKDDILSWWLEPFLNEERTVTRTQMNGIKYNWLIEQSSPDCNTTVYIAQPVVGMENDQSLLTVISTGDIGRVVNEVLCLSAYFLQQRSVVTASINGPDNPPLVQSDSPIDHIKPPESDAEGCFMSQHSNHSPTKGTVPKISVKSGEISSGAENDYVMVIETPDSQASSTTLQGTSLGTLSVPDLTSEATKAEPSTRVELKKSHSFTPDSSTNVKSKQAFKTSGKAVSEDLGQSSKMNRLSPGKPVFLRTISSEKITGIVDYKTLANRCASDVIREVFDASNVIAKPKDRSDSPQPGWVFDSTVNDVAILRKQTPSMKYPCWLGKGIIKCAPDDVWKALTNPHTRYVHDEMLKELTVLHDLGNGMKLLRFCYSTNQLLRKDSREFYVLQAERKENQKYILTLCSVEWPETETKDCPRGKFETCGWIIDPIKSHHGNIYSVVAYVSQIDLGPTDTSSIIQFEEEFITKQPWAVSYLRDYLAL